MVLPIFILIVLIEDLLDLLQRLLVVFLVDLLFPLLDLFLEHLLVFLQEELQPATFSLRLDHDVHIFVNSLILLVDELLEVLRLVVEVDFPSEGLEELENLPDSHKEDTYNDQVEECQLDQKEEHICENQKEE